MKASNAQAKRGGAVAASDLGAELGAEFAEDITMTLINKDIARSVVNRIASDKRAKIIARARKMKAEIEQIFADAEHWNRVNVPWKGPPIDPDPDGQLKRITANIDRMLSNETPNASLSRPQQAKEK